jgi:hypothetical protein
MNDATLVTPADATASSSQRPRVVTAFSGYAPPFDVVPIVEKMLESVPPKYLVGLSEVVLTNTSGLSRKLRRSVTKARKRKVRIVEARGLYRQAWNGKPAWIQIFVDNTLKNWEKGWWRWGLKLPILREGPIGTVLFHELGHHIHAATRPEYRDKEEMADVWKVRLRRHYNRSRSAWMKLLLFPMKLLSMVAFMGLDRRMLKAGITSKAEFDERLKKG